MCECRMVVHIWRRSSPTSFKHVYLYGVCSLILTKFTHQSNRGGPIKKASHLRPIYSNACTWHFEHEFNMSTPPCSVPTKFAMKHQHKPNWKLNVPSFNSGYRRWTFIEFLIERHVLQLRSMSNVEWLFVYESVVQSLWDTCIFMVFALWSSLNHTPIKSRASD